MSESDVVADKFKKVWVESRPTPGTPCSATWYHIMNEYTAKINNWTIIDYPPKEWLISQIKMMGYDITDRMKKLDDYVEFLNRMYADEQTR